MNSTLNTILDTAITATRPAARTSPMERADWLRAIADDLDAARDALVDIAARETHLPPARLAGEVTRTSFQLRFIADALIEGSWLEATIDHADPEWPVAPRPDLRRVLYPVGPVLVVAASNFPFAFSVAGGDTATALGAGCPVIVKTHPGHLELSRHTVDLVRAALTRVGAPDGVFAAVEEEADARAALRDPRVKAGAFTGSVRGGRALYDIACSRPDPIPFYGELGSVNPAFALPDSFSNREPEILSGFIDSFTLNTGQLCTKPGILLAPKTAGLPERLKDLISEVPAAQLLNEHIAHGLQNRLEAMTATLTPTHVGTVTEITAAPSLFEATVNQVLADPAGFFEEAFGPAAVLVEYDTRDDLMTLARSLPGQLTATVHGNPEDPAAQELIDVLIDRAGRLVWNGWPTGVSVTWAMQHGGNWPATTASLHTSVGPTALRRFVRPVALQNLPVSLSLPAVADSNPWHIWRRLDGTLTTPEPSTADAR